MSSVTQRINEIKQPRGGYLNPKELSSVSLGSGIEELAMEENISPSLVGITVDYLTRFMTGADITEAFKISFLGARIMDDFNNAILLAKNINGLDDKSIINAVKLSGYDAAFRAGPIAYRPIDELNADNQTCNNIRIMVNRGIEFFNLYGPVTADGFTFEPSGYTDIVDTGDGDFLTADTLWDFKVSKKIQQINILYNLLCILLWVNTRVKISINHFQK